MKKLVMAAMLFLAVGLLPLAGQADLITFTNEADFLNALVPGYYNENFSSLNQGVSLGPTLNFIQNGFSYTLSALNDDFFALPILGITGLNAISTSGSGSTIQGLNFTSTGNTLTAIGGLFYLTDLPGNIVAGTVTVTVNGVATNITYPGPEPLFFGVIDTGGISSMFCEPQGGGNYATISGLTVGAAAVPLPPTVFLLGSGLLGLAGWRKFRKS